MNLQDTESKKELVNFYYNFISVKVSFMFIINDESKGNKFYLFITIQHQILLTDNSLIINNYKLLSLIGNDKTIKRGLHVNFGYEVLIVL